MNVRKLLKPTLFFLTLLLFVVACQSGSTLQANAGSDFTLTAGESPTFDGCASTGEIVNYRWQIITAPDARSDDADKMIREIDPNCSFTLETAMVVEEVGEWLIELQVRDADGNSSTDTLRVTVTP